MAYLKTKAEAEFVLVLKDGREFWEGMEVQWNDGCGWEKNTISDHTSSTTITLGLVLDNPDKVQIPQPPPEKTPIERMREAERIINVDGRIWRAIGDLKPSLGAIFFLDSNDEVRVQRYRIYTIEILLDSGEWKNLKEMVG